MYDIEQEKTKYNEIKLDLNSIFKEKYMNKMINENSTKKFYSKLMNNSDYAH
jgi:hypothetical protein